MIKSCFNFKIIKSNEIIDMHEKNLWVSMLIVPSSPPRHSVEELEGRNGVIHQGVTLGGRTLSASIQIEGVDPQDFDLFKDELNKIFNPLEEIYIVRDMQPGKRYKVRVSNSFSVDYLTEEDGEFDVEFDMYDAFVESAGTTLDPLTTEVNLWQVAQGLITEEPKYTHSTTSFKIYNAGTVEIDPREHYLEIRLSGKSVSPKITNLTTGDEWQYYGSTSASNVIIITGVRTVLNSLYNSIFGETNRELIRLAPGWNDFRISGVTEGDFEIRFDYRFLYL